MLKIFIITDDNMALNKVYQKMIINHKNKNVYDRIYNKFIREMLGHKNIRDLTSNDIDYFYVYLKKKTYNGHLYSQSYIKMIMNLLKNIFDYGIENKYIDTNLVEIKLYFTQNH